MPVAVRIAVALLDRRALQRLLSLLAGGLLFVVVLVATLGGLATSRFDSGSWPSPTALADIPPGYLASYQAAAQRYGLDWAIIAAIGKVECDHGRLPDPACSTVGVENSAGAGGPMQFLRPTWAAYGVDATGARVSDTKRWDPEAAIYSAANYLEDSGAPEDYDRAIFAYNHASWYVAKVKTWAARYRAAAAHPIPTGPPIPGQTARITEQGYALAPALAPPAVQRMIAAGNQLVHFPYVYGGGHAGGPALDLRNPQPSGGGYDCSSTVSYLLHAAAVLDQMQASSPLTSFGARGPGRWVTVYANHGHTFIVVAGIVMNTAWYAPIRPTSPSSGPRWQPGSTAQEQLTASSYGGFVVRHPPGL